MTVPGLDNETFSLRRKIHQLQSELNKIDKPVEDLPELISSANLLRANECLSESNAKKNELLSVYDQYTKSLEAMLSTVLDIQKELTSILKEQSSMVSETKTKKNHPKSRKSSK